MSAGSDRLEYVLCNESTIRVGRNNVVNEIAFGSSTISRSSHVEVKFLTGTVTGVTHRISWLNGRTTLSAGSPFTLNFNRCSIDVQSFTPGISALNQSTPLRPNKTPTNDQFNPSSTGTTTTATMLSSSRPTHPAIRNILSLEQRHRAETHQSLIKRELDLSLDNTIYPSSENITFDADATLTFHVVIAVKDSH